MPGRAHGRGRRKLSHNERVGREIARVLGERKVHLVTRTVELIGERLTRSVLSETMHLNKEGKMLKTVTGRERTLGGAFFTLLKERVTKEKYKEIYALEEEQKKIARRNKERAARIRRENELIGGMTSQLHLRDDEEEGEEPCNPRYLLREDKEDEWQDMIE
ncbi:hypothetical protein THRCLA_02055 [Thraustotheca clavata]|uniref:Phosphorylated adapter RNA export protein n=1 Tax=Thraustotheca clavata TaxID=74557 RepID=A0A1W0A6G6_9STRA|nr:hypothetical protein THRCLA_02055 [Thraustotheca clavata]